VKENCSKIPAPTINTAMVMSAGLGTRMANLTRITPKPLISVQNKKLIDYSLDELAAGGIGNAVVNVHYLADQIEAHIKTRQQSENTQKPKITISDERDMLLETGGGLCHAKKLLGEHPFFCCNTDAIFADTSPGTASAILKSNWHNKMLALLLLVPIEKTKGFDGNGDFHLQEDQHITKAQEEAALYAFTGMQILHPDLLQNCPDGPFSTRLLWRRATEEKRLFGCVYPHHWLHVGTPGGVLDAQEHLSR